MVKEVTLSTKGMYDEMKEEDPGGYKLWDSIAELMDGKRAVIVVKRNQEGIVEYIFAGLEDDLKNKELYYLVEQDPVIGAYIDDREAFDHIWHAGEYAPDGALYLEKKNIKLDDI